MIKAGFQSEKNFKIIFLGETGAGKSSIIEKICSEKVTCLDDCNVEFGTKDLILNDFSVTLQFYNVIDSDKMTILRLKGKTEPFYKDTALLVIVLDLSQKSYVETLSRWFFEIEKYNRLFKRNFKVLCLGTKSDLKNKDFWMHSELLGSTITIYSTKFRQDIRYYEVSSSDCTSCN